MQDNRDFVLARPDGRSIFNFYPSLESAQADMGRANGSGFDRDCNYEAMNYAEFKRRNRAFTGERLVPAVRRGQRNSSGTVPILYGSGTGETEAVLCA